MNAGRLLGMVGLATARELEESQELLAIYMDVNSELNQKLDVERKQVFELKAEIRKHHPVDVVWSGALNSFRIQNAGKATAARQLEVLSRDVRDLEEENKRLRAEVELRTEAMVAAAEVKVEMLEELYAGNKRLTEELVARDVEVTRLEIENEALIAGRYSEVLARRLGQDVGTVAHFPVQSVLQQLAGGEPDESDPEVPDTVVYDGENTLVFALVRIWLEEGGSHKWLLSQGSEALEVSAHIKDPAFLERVKRREVTFAAGDCVRVRLHTLSRRRGADPIRSTYTVLEVVEVIPPAAVQEVLEIEPTNPQPRAAAGFSPAHAGDAS